jgi:hypothetical protein
MNTIAPTRKPTGAPLLRLRLSGEPQSAGVARRQVRQVLADHVRPEVLDDVELIASELVANAISTTPRLLVLQLYFDGKTPVRVTVSDPDPALPVMPPVDLMAEHGRGLQIIEALSSAWGSTRRRPVGKTVWSDIAA